MFALAVIAGQVAGILAVMAGIVAFYARRVRASARRYGYAPPSYPHAVGYLLGRKYR
jgi:hypothetical protein